MSDLPEGTEGTGIYATEEEQAELLKLAEEARKTPVILLFGKHDLAGDARKRMFERTYEIALSHGLPEIEGYYGLAEDGEFIKMVGQ